MDQEIRYCTAPDGVRIAYATAGSGPPLVKHLILSGGFAGGLLTRGRMSPEQAEEMAALLTLIKIGWGRDDPSYRQIFTNRVVPDATPEQTRWFNELARISVSAENAVRL